MKRQYTTVCLLTLALAAFAMPAAAVSVFEAWTVTLNSGTSFESRYEPVEATWSEDVITFMTTMGNWIAVPKSDVADVRSARSGAGYGKRIDKHTIQLGYVANDGDAEGGKRGFYASDEGGAQRSYDVQQFVNPGQAGGGGLPLGFVYGNTGPNSGSFPTAAQPTLPAGGGGAPAEPPVQ